MNGFLRDLRHAARRLSRNPVFTAVAVLTLALGIGASTAIFSVADLVLWKPLPVRAPNELVVLRWSASGLLDALLDELEGGWDEAGGGFASESFSYPFFERLRKDARSLGSVAAAAANTEDLNVKAGGRSESATGQFVSGNFFEVLGVGAQTGRVLSASDDVAGAAPVAVASRAFWDKWLEAGDDRTIVVNGASVTVVGAAPPGFFGVDPSVEPDLWLPLHAGPAILRGGAGAMKVFADPRTWWVRVIGRLRPGASPSAILAETRALFDQSRASASKALPASRQPVLTVASALRGVDSLRRSHTSPLWLLLATVGVLLAIACANVAGLLVARAAARRGEIAVRASLGASRARLVGLLSAESLVLCAAGSVGGVLLASSLSEALRSLLGSPGVTATRAALDPRALAFALSATVVTALLSGVLPAWRSSRTNLSGALKTSFLGPRGGGRGRVGRSLVTAQVAATVALLFVAGLFVRTLDNLRRAPVGFDTESLLLFRVRPGLNGYEGARLVRFYEDLRARLAETSGVASASFSQYPLLGGGVSTTYVREGGAPLESNRECDRNLVGPEFFATHRIPVLSGRALDERDGVSAPRVAVLNARLARRMFGDADPLGRLIDFGDPASVRRFEVVGVVADTRFQDLRGDMPPTVFLSFSQVSDPPRRMVYEVRSKGDAAALAPAAREALRALDPDLPVVGFETQRRALARVLQLERLLASLTASFGLTALALSCLGLYGSLSLAVASRTREIGVRMALGAQRRRVVRMVVSSGLRLVFAGAAVGLLGALATTRLLRAQLFGLAPHDPISLVAAIALLFAAAAVACAIPARRASRIDPMTALRTE